MNRKNLMKRVKLAIVINIFAIFVLMPIGILIHSKKPVSDLNKLRGEVFFIIGIIATFAIYDNIDTYKMLKIEFEVQKEEVKRLRIEQKYYERNIKNFMEIFNV